MRTGPVLDSEAAAGADSVTGAAGGGGTDSKAICAAIEEACTDSRAANTTGVSMTCRVTLVLAISA